MRLHPSAHTDTFTRDHLPPAEQWPELVFDLPELQYPAQLNAAVELLDRQAEQHPTKVALLAEGQRWTYGELRDRSNQLALLLRQDLHLLPGQRVLLHGPNTPMLAACWFAILKAGGVAVTTMPLLRAHELVKVLDKAQISHALYDERTHEVMHSALKDSGTLKHLRPFTAAGGELLAEAQAKPADAPPVPTSSDDVALIAVTSGTTGQPKGCLHFHHDLLSICHTFARHVLKAEASDTFIGSPPFAFTFGLGGQLLFPLYLGATAALLENGTPANLAAGIAQFGATVCFTAPTSYRMMAALPERPALHTLRKCVSAGEALSAATRAQWRALTGLELIDGIGSTELLHILRR